MQDSGGTRGTPSLANVRWLGHDSFLIVDEARGKRIYVDPYQLGHHEPADLILISHDHFDHFSLEDVAKLEKPDTVFVTVPSVAKQLPGRNVIAVQPGDKVVASDVPVEAVAAYNVNKFRSPGQPFHPKSAGFVGFILTVDGRRIYHTGDADLIPEMAGLQVDVALLPVSGTYVMTPEEAAEAAARIRPGVAVPMHYGAIVGSEADARRFAQLAAEKGVAVEILSRS